VACIAALAAACCPAWGAESLPAELGQLLPHDEVSMQSAFVAVRVNGVALWWCPCATPLSPPALLKALGKSVGKSVGNTWHGVSAAGTASGGWVYTARLGTRLHTLQLHAAASGGSSGYCSVLDASLRPSPVPHAPLILPGDARVVSVIEQLDAPARSTQYMGATSEPPARWQARLLNGAQRAGWQLLVAGEAAQAGAPLGLLRGSQQLEVLVLPDAPGSRFLINQHARPGPLPGSPSGAHP
jgi:hypothetical protein